MFAFEPQFFTAGVPDATRIIPEPGNPDVDIEVVDNAILTSLGNRAALALASIDRQPTQRA